MRSTPIFSPFHDCPSFNRRGFGCGSFIFFPLHPISLPFMTAPLSTGGVLGVDSGFLPSHTQSSGLSRLFLLAPADFWVWTLVFFHPTPNSPPFCDSSFSQRLSFGCIQLFSYLPHPILCLFAALPSRSDCLLGVNSSFPTSHTQFPAFSRFSLLSPAGFWVWELHFLPSTPNFLPFKL